MRRCGFSGIASVTACVCCCAASKTGQDGELLNGVEKGAQEEQGIEMVDQEDGGGDFKVGAPLQEDEEVGNPMSSMSEDDESQQQQQQVENPTI